jgi:hypothetical protein
MKKSMFIRACANLLIGAGLFFVSNAAMGAPKYRAELTVSGYTGTETLEGFPVLVRISESKISGFSYADCAENGADISFRGVDGRVLAHEIDTWDTSGESLVWVKLPTLATNTTFTIHWKDKNPNSSETTTTWSNYVGVWHMGEESGTCANSSPCGAKYDAVPKSKTQYNVRYTGADAPIGHARTTSSVDSGVTGYWNNGARNYRSYLYVASYHEENVGDTFTISSWVRVSDLVATDNNSYRIFSKKSVWNASDGFEVEMSSSDTKFNARTVWKEGTANEDVNGSFPSLLKNWVHVAFVFSNSTLRVYGNGVKMTTNRETVTPVVENETFLAIGANATTVDGVQPHLIGAFDECRLMKGAASADWVKAEYDAVNNADFVKAGAAKLAAFVIRLR